MSKEEKELYEEICELFGSEYIENKDFVEIDGVKYSYEEKEDLDIISEGKYEYGRTIYAVGILNEEKGYGIKETLFYIEQDFTRTGSYYSDWEYEYETPYLVEQKEITKTIWKAIK